MYIKCILVLFPLKQGIYGSNLVECWEYKHLMINKH